LFWLVACDSSDDGGDGSSGADTGAGPDAAKDSGPADTGAIDTGAIDTGAIDTGAIDTGAIDTGETTDADPADADSMDVDPLDGDTDATPGDAGEDDAGPADTGNDAGVDAGEPDTGTSTFGCGLPPPPYAAGEVSCPGCPASNPPPASFVLQLGAVTQNTFSGTVQGAVGDGQFFVVGTGTTAGELFGAVPVNAGGGYSANVPLFCGLQYVIFVFCNATGSVVITYEVTTTGCTEPDLRATIVWDAIGDDWELHLIRPGGQINDNATDCTWTSCIPTGPDWGVLGDPTDNPMKDVDDVDGYGPENIILAGPETGTFTVMVEHWGPGSPMSDGFVILNVQGQTFVADIIDFPPRFVRTAFTITFPGPTVATSTVIHDCTGNWSGGCRDPIP
jgi:hypothetical protein